MNALLAINLRENSAEHNVLDLEVAELSAAVALKWMPTMET
jgi:hypothetical protein